MWTKKEKKGGGDKEHRTKEMRRRASLRDVGDRRWSRNRRQYRHDAIIRYLDDEVTITKVLRLPPSWKFHGDMNAVSAILFFFASNPHTMSQIVRHRRHKWNYTELAKMILKRKMKIFRKIFQNNSISNTNIVLRVWLNEKYLKNIIKII